MVAAVEASRRGDSVVVVSPDTHLGGMSSSGLGWTDMGDKSVVGGLSREFYHRIWRHYQSDDAWRQQSRESFGNRAQGGTAIDGDLETMWVFEPHVAEQVFEDLIAEHKIRVDRNRRLDRASGVKMSDTRITSMTTLDGHVYRGRVFIDATYEGDLLAAAGVSYHVGREANNKHNEQWNGVQVGVLHHGHHFGVIKGGVSPYVKPGDPASGLLPRISQSPPGEYGAGDAKVQAYCFRTCLTDHPANRVPFPKPTGYDPTQYELLLRILRSGWRTGYRSIDRLPNLKTDTNNHGPFSTDNIGFNYDYPEADYDRRREIVEEHRIYQQGLMYFLANDPRVPQDVRTIFQRYGLAADEFTDNGNWPHQLYIREARRMVGAYVLTEHDVLNHRQTPQPIGMGSYTMDSHNVQRYVTPEGLVQNEGDIGVPVGAPYQIAYGSITPQNSECENLLAPVCVSSSHIAYGSVRMEPVFMILGQSAAVAASLAIDGDGAVQEVSYAVLRKELEAAGQVLENRP